MEAKRGTDAAQSKHSDDEKLVESVSQLRVAESKGWARAKADTKGKDRVVSSAAATTPIVANASPEEIGLGIRILEMSMSDYGSASPLWVSTAFAEEDDDSRAGRAPAPCFRATEMSERVPKEILQCRAVSREICFSSVHPISQFRLEQRVHMNSAVIEHWHFRFGYVMPGSTNTWQQIIEAAPAMIPAEQLSGNVAFETIFLDGDRQLASNMTRFYYV